jgi:hypothetical protein
MSKPYLFQIGRFTASVVGAPSERAALAQVKRLYPAAKVKSMGEDTRTPQEQWDSGSLGIVYQEVK